MRTILISVFVAATAWVLGSYVTALQAKADRDEIAEYSRFTDGKNATPDFSVGDFVPFEDDIEIGIECIVQSIGSPKGCRMFSNAQACKQVQCEANKCTGDNCSVYQQASQALACDLLPSVCVDGGLGTPVPTPTPPRVECKWYDVGCRIVFDNEKVTGWFW